MEAKKLYDKHYIPTGGIRVFWNLLDEAEKPRSRIAIYNLHSFLQKCFPDLDLDKRKTWTINKTSILKPYILYIKGD